MFVELTSGTVINTDYFVQLKILDGLEGEHSNKFVIVAQMINGQNQPIEIFNTKKDAENWRLELIKQHNLCRTKIID